MSATELTDIAPGPVLACGQVYLRAHVSQMLRSDGKYSYIFPVAEREKIGEVWCTNNFRLLWGGDEGTEFVRAHEAALKPGAAINIIFGRLRPHTDLTGTELQGHIRSAAMPPPALGRQRENGRGSPYPKPRPPPACRSHHLQRRCAAVANSLFQPTRKTP